MFRHLDRGRRAPRRRPASWSPSPTGGPSGCSTAGLTGLLPGLRRGRRGGRRRRPRASCDRLRRHGAGVDRRPGRRHRQLRRRSGAVRGDGGAAGGAARPGALDPRPDGRPAGGRRGGRRGRTSTGSGCEPAPTVPAPRPLRGVGDDPVPAADLAGSGRGRRPPARRGPARPALRRPGVPRTSLAGKQQFALFWRTLPWDHAPGVLLLREAGGVVRRLDGGAVPPGRRPGTGCWSRSTTGPGTRSATRSCPTSIWTLRCDRR